MLAPTKEGPPELPEEKRAAPTGAAQAENLLLKREPARLVAVHEVVVPTVDLVRNKGARRIIEDRDIAHLIELQLFGFRQRLGTLVEIENLFSAFAISAS